jgi:hypothetical protein
MPEPEGPEDRARVHWSVPPPPLQAVEAEAPGDPAALGEEFLFHLYRGSELLKEDQVYEAKSELERAISLQPRDVEGQSLLGIVYFRLGHYPRAIQIYEELVRARPQEVAPRVNLALCHLKTGQVASARVQLEEIVQHRPDHLRAWGYLGLAHQRLGDIEKATVAFDRAGRHELAARLRTARVDAAQSALESVAPPPLPGVMEIAQEDASAALAAPPLPRDLGTREIPPSRRSGAAAPGTRVSLPVSMGRAIHDRALVFPEHPRVVLHESGVVLCRVQGSFHVRGDHLRAVLPEGSTALRSTPFPRPGRNPGTEEPFSAFASRLSTLEGKGRLVLGAPASFIPFVAPLDGEPLYVREERLLGFEGSLAHQEGRLNLSESEPAVLVQLTGLGFVVLAVRNCLATLEVLPERPVQVAGDRLVGWVGRVLARPLARSEAPGGSSGLVTLSGTGSILLDGG